PNSGRQALDYVLTRIHLEEWAGLIADAVRADYQHQILVLECVVFLRTPRASGLREVPCSFQPPPLEPVHNGDCSRVAELLNLKLVRIVHRELEPLEELL